MQIVLALFLYLIGTLIYFGAEIQFLKEAINKNWLVSFAWVSLKVVSIPFYAYGTYLLYNYSKSWWLVEFPYWFMYIAVSYIAYSRFIKVAVGWREVVSAALLVVIAVLLSSNEQ